MPLPLTPGVYVEEVPSGARPIEAVGTSTPAFVGFVGTPDAPVGEPVAVNNWLQYLRLFPSEGPSTPLTLAVAGFFGNGGQRCFVLNVGEGGTLTGTTRRPGISVLEEVDEVAIVAAPGYTDAASYEALLQHCENQKDRVAILDAPLEIEDISQLTRVGTAPPDAGPDATPSDADAAADGASEAKAGKGRSGSPRAAQAPGVAPRQSSWGAYYYPWIRVVDPATGRIVEAPPSGHLAGVWARTDATHGVHKAPANEPIRGAVDLTYRLTSAEQGELNTAGVNGIRFFSTEGIKVWGARTLAGSSSEWRYLNVRRLFAMVEESIMQGMNWIPFQNNDPILWNMIRRDVGSFLERLYRQGALMGRTPAEAFFVKCDDETNPRSEIDAGVVTTYVGLAPVKPAEFIVFKVSQYQGGASVEQEGQR
ncbi:phage tail sheath family protein [Cellulomonas humilata]|uniref:Phage tail sheath protein FI n=1 Tax=Cellulomonas humilata TaxID=144055 RepID=A0ABU0EFK6_9CELL|nr:phage tail sheath subtilisin-like domain-containing protein [Cellulomonas humilata]MDQ0373836.1 phage tail sheath protein FI [Cellulomonas humilata]